MVFTATTCAAGDYADRGAGDNAAKNIQASISYQFDDNVTRAPTGFDQPSDLVLNADVRQRFFHPLTEHARGVLDWQLAASRSQKFHGLSRVSGGLHGELQYRATADFDAPMFAGFADVTVDQYASTAQDGLRYALGVSVQQSLTDRIALFGALAHQGRQARNSAFDQQDHSARLGLDYAVNDRHTLYLGAEYRRGDNQTTTRRDLSNARYARVVYPNDDAFTRLGLNTYRYHGDTAITTVGYNISLHAVDAVDFSWVRARSAPIVPGGGAPHYTANQFSIAYIRRF